MSTRRPIEIHPYDASWPAYFALFAYQLRNILTGLASIPAGQFCIHHIGSTSVRGLAAKPNIDIAITVPNDEVAVLVREALIWEPEGSEHYRWIGNGGILGRMSMKLADQTRMPYRSVYIIAMDNDHGVVGYRGYRDVRKVLQEDEELRREYEECKWKLVSGDGITNGVVYGQAKNEIIAKVLKKAGWTPAMIQAKEDLDTRDPNAQAGEDDWPYCY